MEIELLLLRLVFGLGLAAHGAQKLFSWFDGQGLRGTGRFLEGLGFYPGKTFAVLNGVGEVVGGLLFAFGFVTPLGAAMMIQVMIVAMLTVHAENGFFNQKNGVELPLLYAVVAAAVALSGPGRYSLDTAIGLTDLWTSQIGMVAIAMAILGGLGTLMGRRAGRTSQKSQATRGHSATA